MTLIKPLATLILIVIVLLAFLWAWVGPLVMGELQTIPLSNHALTQERSYNASEVRNLINDGSCQPVEAYYCTGNNNSHLKVVCNLKGDLWLGLIVGLDNTEQIVTGYPAPWSYWASSIARDNCAPTAIVP